MIKRSILVSVCLLCICVGRLHHVRQQSPISNRFLTLSVPQTENNWFGQLDIVILHPNGQGGRVLYDNLPYDLQKVQWSADRKWLYLLGDRPRGQAGWEYSIERVKPFEQTKPEQVAINEDVPYLAFTPERWVYADADYAWHTSEGVPLPDILFGYTNMIWSPNGEWLIFTNQNVPQERANDIFRMHRSGDPIENITHAPEMKYSPTISPDGQWLAYTSEFMVGSPAKIWRINFDGTPESLLLKEAAFVGELAWSADSRYLAYTELQDGADHYELWLMDQQTQESTQLPVGQKDIIDIQWDADDPTVIYYSTYTPATAHAEVYRMDVVHQTTQRIYGLKAKNTNDWRYILLTWSPPFEKTWHPLRIFIVTLYSLVMLMMGLFLKRILQR